MGVLQGREYLSFDEFMYFLSFQKYLQSKYSCCKTMKKAVLGMRKTDKQDVEIVEYLIRCGLLEKWLLSLKNDSSEQKQVKL